MATASLILSADSHMMEPPDLWAKSLPAKFRDRAPVYGAEAIDPFQGRQGGWNPIDGRDAVMESWEAILTGSGSPKIKCKGARAHVIGGVAYVTCHEILDRGFLVATNVFVHEDGSWKMVHHHAGTAPPPAEGAAPDAPPTMQ